MWPLVTAFLAGLIVGSSVAGAMEREKYRKIRKESDEKVHGVLKKLREENNG